MRKSLFSNQVFKRILFFFVMVSFSGLMQAQVSVKGIVKDDESGEPMIGARVMLIGQPVGAMTDEDGKFSFESPINPPFKLLVTYIGYDSLEYEVENLSQKIKLNMTTQGVEMEGVEIIGQSISEKQKTAPLTVESMGSINIRESPAPDFYAALGNLKGVDLTSASIGFKIINTRGFNSTSPVRSLQIIDGVDNASPGLNFSLGNFLGASELDVQKVDLVVGASSAFYGPNAFNGVISMETKSPFLHPGLTVMLKGGERYLAEGAIRYARVFKNKKDDPKFAFRLNLFFMRANDWEATNMDATPQSRFGSDNPGGYDAVNRYGDENLTNGINNADTKTDTAVWAPGLGIWHRDGYNEEDVVNYNTRNGKASASLHYMINPRTELLYGFNFGAGTTVYQGDNRYSLKNILFFQNKIEIRETGKWFFRAYSTNEDAGDSYDAVFTAFKMQEAAKSNNNWTVDYRNYWQINVTPRIKALEGWPAPPGIGSPFDYAAADSILEANYDSLVVWHQETRDVANGANPIKGDVERFEPGTERFDSLLQDITSKEVFAEGGTRFFDKSALYHAHGEYKFTPKWATITVGANGRLYRPNSRGTIFADTNGRVITNWEFGVYTGVEKKFFKEKLIANATVRMDKNENFPFLFSPAASMVYKATENHIIRGSFSSAIRNPTLQDQYLYYDVGRALLVGNIDGWDSLVTVPSLFDFFDSRNADTLEWINIAPVVPEKVKSFEVGYRGILFKKLFIDASYYYSFYQDFIGYKLGADIEYDSGDNTATIQRFYRVSANADDIVTTQGASIGLNYYFARYFGVNGNYSWNVLNKKGTDDPIIPAFNTPEHKFNLGFSGRDIEINWGKLHLNNLGFNVTFKWVEGFEFQGSPQFTGFVPSYYMLDAQINKKVPKIHTTFKLGASNLTNNKVLQVYGGPRIGRLAYFAIIFEMDEW